MDNVLIAYEIEQHNLKVSNEVNEVNEVDKDINNEALKKRNEQLNRKYNSFLQYMDTLRPNITKYDVKLEIEKYRMWSKNAESAYH